MLALRAVRGSGCSAPGFAAFDTLPPDFASRAGLQDALRLQPAPTIARLNGEGRIWYAFW